MHQMCISTTEVVLLSDAQVEKVSNPKKRSVNWKSRGMKTKQSAMKLNQIRRRIDLRRIYKIYFLLDISIHIRNLKQVPKYLATGL
jgi:hypothetical protein